MDSTHTNTVEFTGSGREILELMKKALCEFKNIYVVNAFLHPHHGFVKSDSKYIDKYSRREKMDYDNL